VLSGLAEGISALVRIVIFVGALFWLDWRLALVSLVVAPVCGLTARRFSGLVKEASREKRRRSGSLAAVAEESLSNNVLVQTSNREQSELDRFLDEQRVALTADLTATRVKATFAPMIDLTELAGALLVIGWGTWALARAASAWVGSSSS